MNSLESNVHRAESSKENLDLDSVLQQRALARCSGLPILHFHSNTLVSCRFLFSLSLSLYIQFPLSLFQALPFLASTTIVLLRVLHFSVAVSVDRYAHAFSAMLACVNAQGSLCVDLPKQESRFVNLFLKEVWLSVSFNA